MTERHDSAVGPREVRVVARRASDLPAAGEPRIKKQCASERLLLLTERIVHRKRRGSEHTDLMKLHAGIYIWLRPILGWLCVDRPKFGCELLALLRRHAWPRCAACAGARAWLR